jgi:hypothetical protein
MDIYCPACQQKLQIADSSAGQMVKCPSCAATFQGPSLPSLNPVPVPEPLGPSPNETQKQTASGAAASPVQPGSVRSETLSSSSSSDAYTRKCAVPVRQDIVTLIPPIGLFILFLMSFLPWRHEDLTSLNLWQLAFSAKGFNAFLFYVLVLLLAAPIVFAIPIFDRNIVPAPVQVRPYLPYGAAIVAILMIISWFFFLTHYFQCTFMEQWDPATLWMKLAFRLHTLMAAAALLDPWLRNRKRQGIADPRIEMRW